MAGAFAFAGDGPGGGQTFRARRMLGDGDLRLIALSLIAESPRHGYDIIKALEEKSRGAYSPSPGVVYPTLTFLEEAGYVTSAAEGSKRVYTITDSGRAYLAENEAQVAAVLAEIERFGRRMEGARAWFEFGEHGEPADPEEYRERPGRPDLRGAFKELRAARRDLKIALGALIEAGPEALSRGVEILRKAAEDVRHAAESLKDTK
ncbi:MAG: PadR family transcriptional regulator [Bauldia sp.]|nr:PadR family transcriptional regulator [Bauldia sp.]